MAGDRIETSSTPGLVELLQAAVNQGLADLHTAMPGRVEKYDPVTQTANVKPLLKRNVLLADGTELEPEVLPVIPKVPVLWFRAGGFYITAPLSAGDPVLLVFNERSIDNYMLGIGQDTDPIDTRMHDLSDAIAIPGFYPLLRALKPEVEASATGLAIGSENAGVRIELTGTGVNITKGGVNILSLEGVGPTAVETVGDGSSSATLYEAMATWWAGFRTGCNNFDGHGHDYASPGGPAITGPPVVTVVPVTPPSVPVAIGCPVIDPAMKSTHLKVPTG